jgi:hypothetical protein
MEAWIIRAAASLIQAAASGVTSGDSRPEDDNEEGFAVMVISSYLPEDHGAVGSHPGRAPGQDHRRDEHRRGDRMILYAALH